MKKLLLASMIMIGMSAVVSAQTPEAVKAKKAAAKADKNQPALTTTTTEKAATAKIDPAKEKTDAEVAKQARAAAPVEVKKAEHPHKGKRQNQ